MGLFDKFKKVKSSMVEETNKVDKDSYVREIKGIVFIFEEKPSENHEEQMQSIADNYWNNMNYIIEFMMPDLQEVYGDIDIETVKGKLGRPIIDYEKIK